MLGIPAVSLIANIVEVGLFGAYTALFLVCLIVMASKRSSVNRLLSTAAVVMYILCTICLAIDVMRIFQGFSIPDRRHRWMLEYSVTSPNNAPEYVRGYLFTVDAALGDLVIIWRCYAVWNRNIWICAVPLATWMGTLGSALVSMWYITDFPTTGVVATPMSRRLSTASLATSIATNVIATSLIAGRVWWHKRTIQRAFHERARHLRYYNWILAIVIESGLVYTSFLIAELVLYVSGSNFILIATAALSQVGGMVPTAIIVYAAMGKTLESTVWTTASIPASAPAPTQPPPSGSGLPPGLPASTSVPPGTEQVGMGIDVDAADLPVHRRMHGRVTFDLSMGLEEEGGRDLERGALGEG